VCDSALPSLRRTSNTPDEREEKATKTCPFTRGPRGLAGRRFSRSLDGPVDGGAGNREQLGELGAGVFARAPQLHEVRFLRGLELGLLAAQPPLGLGDLHAFSGPHPDQVGLELSDHPEEPTISLWKSRDPPRIMVVAEERAAARLEYTGTHTGTLLGHTATGRRFAYAGAAFFTASAYRLTDAWVLGDVTTLTAQLR